MNCEDEDESSRDMKDQTLPKISQGMEFKQVQVDIREGKPRRRHDLLRQHCFRQWKIR